MKELIDKDINNNNFHIFLFISGNKDNNWYKLCKTKGQEGKLTIVNFQDFYGKNVIRKSELISNKHIYYVSNDGNSKDELSKNDQMNIEIFK